MTVDADSVTVDSGPLAGNVYDALEFSGNQPRFVATGPVTGEAVWIGLACDEVTTENAESFPEGGVAIARRGDCLFATKLATAASFALRRLSSPTTCRRFFDNSPEFIEANGGNPHDFWGVYKIENEPFVYGSDRNSRRRAGVACPAGRSRSNTSMQRRSVGS